MKIKLDSIEALAKAHSGLGAHFKKMADHHDSLSKAHGEHSAFLKGKHDAMADDDMHKAFFHKAAEHHDGLHKMHKAASEHYSGMADELSDKAADDKDLGKTAAGAATTEPAKVGEVVNIGEFLQKQIAEGLTDLGKAADFKDMVNDFLRKIVKEQLGQTIVPSATKAVGTTADPATLVARPGEKLPENMDKAIADAPAGLGHFFN